MTPTQRNQSLRRTPILLIPWVQDKHFVLVIVQIRQVIQSLGEVQTRQAVVVDPLGGVEWNGQALADLKRALGCDNIQEIATGLQKDGTLDCALWVLAACQHALIIDPDWSDTSAVISGMKKYFLSRAQWIKLFTSSVKVQPRTPAMKGLCALPPSPTIKPDKVADAA